MTTATPFYTLRVSGQAVPFLLHGQLGHRDRAISLLAHCSWHTGSAHTVIGRHAQGPRQSGPAAAAAAGPGATHRGPTPPRWHRPRLRFPPRRCGRGRSARSPDMRPAAELLTELLFLPTDLDYAHLVAVLFGEKHHRAGRRGLLVGSFRSSQPDNPPGLHHSPTAPLSTHLG